MKSSEILRRAAKRLDSGKSTSSFIAIDDVAPSLRSFEEADRFFSFVAQWPHHFDLTVKQQVIALCFAAAIAESEGD